MLPTVSPEKRKIWLIILLLAFLHCLPAFSYAQRFLFTTYRLNENLYEPNSEIVSGYVKVICQTRNKWLYIGTKFGFCIYDGNKFRNYTRFGEKYIGAVNDFAELDDGRVVVLSNTHGMLVLDKGQLTAMSVFPKTPAPRFISFHRTPGNALLVSSTNGIYRFRKDHFVKTSVTGGNSGNFFYDLENINDNLLLASNAAGSPFTLFDSTYHLVKSYPLKDVVYDVQADKKGNLWMATPSGLKRVITKELLAGQFKFEQIPATLTKAGIDGKIVVSLYADPYANLWAGTAFGGLFRIDSLFNVTQFHFRNGFNFDRVNCFLEDAEHNLWLGTENGLAKIPDPRIVKYISNDGLQSSTVNNLHAYRDDLLGISTGNVFQVDEQDHQKITLIDTLAEAISIFSTDSALYVYSSSKILQGYKKKGKYLLKKLPLSIAGSLSFKRGALALRNDYFLLPLSSGGLYAIEGKTGSRLPGISYIIDNMYYDKASQLLWVSELDAGLHIYRIGKKLEQLRLDSAVSKNVSAVTSDGKGTFWLATRDKGIFQVVQENNRFRILQHIGTGEGLSSDLCTSILQDSQGKLFAGNTASLDIIQKINGSYVINNLAAQLGYYNEIYTLSEDRQGNIWAGGLSGLLMVPTDANLLSVNKTSTFITRMELTDRIINTPELAGIHPLVLTPNQNDVTFEFASPYMKSESMVRYVYRLLRKGDTTWSSPFTNTSLALKDLPPGSFTFQVKALFPDGSSAENIAAVSFRILSPWYRSWWFISLCVLLMAALLYALYRYRLQQVIRLQQVRNRIASDLHDDIGSTLTNINILSSLGRRNLHEPVQAREFLDRITEEVNSSSQALDDIIWSVNTNNDGLEETVARMRRYAAELFDAGNVHYEFQLDPVLSQKKLSMEQRRDFYLVYKELLNNIFKHAKAKNVWISIHIERNNLILSVKDDGTGFDSLADTHRNGLKNLHTRVGRWQGFIQVRSAPGMGSLIIASLPVKN
jgi:signal transduction histidine kinase/ligand-binding sensor domain-containing protein